MKRTTVDARRWVFEALEDGPVDGALVLLLHGLPRNCWEWHHQIPAIAALGFHVVAPDLRGFCEGARPSGIDAYHVQEYVDDVLAIADAVKGPGTRFHLMGTSIGATVAWRLGGPEPDTGGHAGLPEHPSPGRILRSSESSSVQRR